MNNDELFTIKEAAKYMTVHYNTVRNLIKDGELSATKIRGVVRIKRSEINKFLGIDEVNDGNTVHQDS